MGKKRKRRRRSPPPPMEVGAIQQNFYSAGDRTEQTKEHILKRQKEQKLNQDCFVEESESDEEIEMTELPHKDFQQTQKWGPARKMLEKMGWKEGEGLGRKRNGVLNPITPDERYHCSKMGLGTPVEVRMGITTSSNETPQEWPSQPKSDSPQPWSLPSYLQKKNYKKGAINIPNGDMVEIRDKYRLTTIDLNLAKGSEKHYSAVPFERMQLKKVLTQIELYKKSKNKSDDDCLEDYLLEIGWWIHLQAKKETVSDRTLKFYKEECSKLWYYVDYLVGTKHLYLIFLNDIKCRLDAILYTDFGEPESSKVIALDSDSDDDVVELFGQKSTPPKKTKKLVEKKDQKPADKIIILD